MFQGTHQQFAKSETNSFSQLYFFLARNGLFIGLHQTFQACQQQSSCLVIFFQRTYGKLVERAQHGQQVTIFQCSVFAKEVQESVNFFQGDFPLGRLAERSLLNHYCGIV